MVHGTGVCASAGGSHYIAGTRVSPMTVAVSTSEVRICQDLFNAVSERGINEDTDTSVVPKCKIGHVLRYEDFVFVCGGRCQRR